MGFRKVERPVINYRPPNNDSSIISSGNSALVIVINQVVPISGITNVGSGPGYFYKQTSNQIAEFRGISGDTNISINYINTGDTVGVLLNDNIIINSISATTFYSGSTDLSLLIGGGGSGDQYWISGTSTNDLIRKNSNNDANAGEVIILNGIYNSGYTPTTVISGSRNSSSGSYFVPYSLFTGIYSINKIHGGLNTIYNAAVSNIHNGFYNSITNSSYSSILNGRQNKIKNSPLAIQNGGNLKTYGSSYAINIGNTNTITTALTSYNSFSSIVGANQSNITDSSFSNIWGGKVSVISGFSSYHIHNTVLNSDRGEINSSRRSTIINGFTNFINSSVDSTIISGQDNQINSGSKSSIIFNGSQNILNSTTGLTLINVSNQTINSSITNTLVTDKIRSLFLTGATTQMVVADTLGNLSVQAIPSSGSSTSGSFVQNGINTFTAGTPTFQSVNVTALTVNNITVSGNTLLSATTATTLTVHNLSGAGSRMVIANTVGSLSTATIPTIPPGAYIWEVGGVATAVQLDNGYTTANSDFSLVAGKINTIGGQSNYSSILGGNGNLITERTNYSFIGNGLENYIRNYSYYSLISNGRGNYINNSNKSSILNGYTNRIYNAADVAESKYNSILNGYTNKLKRTIHSNILGGFNNLIGSDENLTKYSLIFGKSHSLQANYSVILGGSSYTLNEDYTVLTPKLKIGNLPTSSSTYLLNANASGNVYKNTISGGTGIGMLNTGGVLTITYTGSSSSSHTIINGLNTFTGGSSSVQTVNISALTIDNITVSGNSSFNSLSATTLYSGTTNLNNVFLNSNSLSGGTNIRISGNTSSLTINSSLPSTGFLTNINNNVVGSPKRYYHNTINYVSSIGVAAPGANTMRFYPFVNNRTISLNEIGANCTTSGASGVVAFALYDSLPNGEARPNNLIQVFGSASTTTTGTKLVTGSTIVLEPGLFWFAINNNSTAQFSSPASGCISLGSNASISTQVASMSSAVTFSMNFPANMSGLSTYAQATLLFAYHPLTVG